MIGHKVRKLVAGLVVLSTTLMVGNGSAHADLWGTPHAVNGDAFWDMHTNDVLRSGSRSNLVGFWQAYIRRYHQIPQYGIDGIFGSATVQGTKNLQSFWGVTPVDGVVGDNTWQKAAQWTYLVWDSESDLSVKGAFAQDYHAFTADQTKGGTYDGYWHWWSCWILPDPIYFMHNTSVSSRAIVPGLANQNCL